MLSYNALFAFRNGRQFFYNDDVNDNGDIDNDNDGNPNAVGGVRGRGVALV